MERRGSRGEEGRRRAKGVLVKKERRVLVAMMKQLTAVSCELAVNEPRFEALDTRDIVT